MSSKSNSCTISERFFRQTWIHQQFRLSDLRTVDGRPVNILSPGKLNTDGGPDFRGARIRIGGVLYGGDVELHRRYREWVEHRHNRDPKYNSVILHVVLQGDSRKAPPLTRSLRSIPVLILGGYLTPCAVSTRNTSIPGEGAERLPRIRCFGLNDSVETARLKSWLLRLASDRADLKIRRFAERLRELAGDQRLQVGEHRSEYGELPFGLHAGELPEPEEEYGAIDFSREALWEQLMYEGIMEALGYGKNQGLFLRLARNLTLRLIAGNFMPAGPGDGAPKLEAALFRISGLLNPPPSTSEKESARYMKLLRNLWTLCGDCYTGEMIGAGEWQFFRLRPENFPTLRLAGAARLIPRLIRKDFFGYMLQIVRSDVLAVRQRYAILENLLTVPAGPFWSTHYRFGERAGKGVKTLIGKGRAAEIIINSIIPICLLHARIYKDAMLEEGASMLSGECPPAIENGATSAIGNQLIKGRFALDSALLQQGALHLHKFYCTEERCSECEVGKVVFRGRTGLTGALLPSRAGRSTS
jgi:uncharacterized protein DUF2851